MTGNLWEQLITVCVRLGGSVIDVISQSVPCLTTHLQFSSLFCDWSKYPSNNAAVAWLIAATVSVHAGVCFTQRKNNEPFWTRLYRGGDKILVGPRTDPPRRTLTVLYLKDLFDISQFFLMNLNCFIISLYSYVGDFFHCRSGLRISRHYRCNGELDCPGPRDQSDELDCPCGAHQSLCANGLCLDTIALCSPASVDAVKCPLPSLNCSVVPCSEATSFRCRNSQCIPLNARCGKAWNYLSFSPLFQRITTAVWVCGCIPVYILQFLYRWNLSLSGREWWRELRYVIRLVNYNTLYRLE